MGREGDHLLVGLKEELHTKYFIELELITEEQSLQWRFCRSTCISLPGMCGIKLEEGGGIHQANIRLLIKLKSSPGERVDRPRLHLLPRLRVVGLRKKEGS